MSVLFLPLAEKAVITAGEREQEKKDTFVVKQVALTLSTSTLT